VYFPTILSYLSSNSGLQVLLYEALWMHIYLARWRRDTRLLTWRDAPLFVQSKFGLESPSTPTSLRSKRRCFGLILTISNLELKDVSHSEGVRWRDEGRPAHRVIRGS
jgi:hypothetical protein